MLLLVSGATKTMKNLNGNPYLGRLYVPATGNGFLNDMPFAVDNSAFSHWDEKAFLKLLIKMKGSDPLFVVAPDVPFNAKKTDDLFWQWRKEIKQMNFRIALALQNGNEEIGIPWDEVDAIFIAGDDDFKLGKYVRWAVSRAREYNKWIHMGRVNSMKRIRYALEIGCDSVDGSGMSKYPDTYIPKFLRFIKEMKKRELFDFVNGL